MHCVNSAYVPQDHMISTLPAVVTLSLFFLFGSKMLRIFYFRVGNRLYSMKAAKKDAKKYTDTINLPKTKFPNRLTAAKREEQERLVLEACCWICEVTKSYVSLYHIAEQDCSFLCVPGAATGGEGETHLRPSRWTALRQRTTSHGPCRQQDP